MAAYKHINKFNCEAWFLDFHEGNLTVAEQEQLFAFVEQNPELADALYNYETPSTLPTFLSPDFAEGLKKPLHENATTITPENLHDFLVADLEGLLTEKQTAQLKRYIATHPEAEVAQKRYAYTRLLPDMQVQFTGKHLLKKRTRVAVLPRRWAYWSAAAILLAAVLLYLPQNNTTAPQLAVGPTLPKQLKSTGRRPTPEQQNPAKKTPAPSAPAPKRNIVKERPIFIQNNEPATPSEVATTQPTSPNFVSPAPIAEPLPETAIVLPQPIAPAETGIGTMHGNKNQVMLALNRFTGMQLFTRSKDRMKADWMNIAKATASFLQRKTGRNISISSSSMAALH